MRWSKDAPTKKGAYWYRQADGEISLIELTEYLGELTTETNSTVAEITEWWGIVAWCGPLVPPEYDL
jgi:hypothetical protein